MGLFDFIEDLVIAGVEVVTSPLAMAADVGAVIEGEVPDNTAKQLGSAALHIIKAPIDLIDK